MRQHESQRVKDQNLRDALRNSTTRRLQQRGREAESARDEAIRQGHKQTMQASLAGQWARAQWTFNNGPRMLRVFA